MARFICLALLLVARIYSFPLAHRLLPSKDFAASIAKRNHAVLASSRFEGNQRMPSAEENALMDEMILRLVEAKPYELPSAVKRAFKVIRSPQFFMRIAELSDQAKTDDDKRRFETLASNLVTTLEAVVETTSEQLDERAVLVETVVKAAAEPDSGDFLVPLTPDRVAAMQKELYETPESTLDEGFLTTLDAWIVKSHQDGMDLMVGILQKVLQMYAGLQIVRALERQETKPDTDLVDLLKSDAEQWDGLLATKSAETIQMFKKEVQRTMETVILSLETGSMAQQVQAEYLKEMLQRIETAESRTA